MEPFPKRQRLFAPAHRDFGRSFADKYEHYDASADSEMVEDEREEEEEEEFDDEPEPENDPDTELNHRRARLDHKLKSTFEAIFEKYGRDFEGVGDEIDLETGEILIDNGHLTEMQNERDAGDVGRSRIAPRAFTTESEDLQSSSMEETEMRDGEDDEEEDDYEEDSTSDGDVVDDDMILRGFAKANRFLEASPEASPEPLPRERHYEVNRRPGMIGNSIPSRSDIISQFGPQLGPQILEYISRQYVSEKPVPDDSHIEPAWRVPQIPSLGPSRRPTKKIATLPPEPVRSPSPNATTSIWAPTKSRNRRGADQERRSSNNMHDTFLIDPLGDVMGDGYEEAPASGAKRPRKNFTIQDDQILQDFATQVRRQNLDIWPISTWRHLENMHPHHSSRTWRARYKLKFTYLWTNEGEEPESSEASVDTTRRLGQPNSVMGRSMMKPPPTVRMTGTDRPHRIRQPAEKDSRIISWSQAVDRIESIDPDLHAGIMEDSRAKKNGKRPEHGNSSSFDPGHVTSHPARVHSYEEESHPPTSQAYNSRLSNSQKGKISSDFMAVNDLPDSSQGVVHCAPCPHADCKAVPSIVYRIQRQEDEELSEMCLHLFYQHHTTPFPCGETNCYHKGKHGYFMQAELVKHVKISHPGAAALQRLRGRVNPKLLDHDAELRSPSEEVEVPDNLVEFDFGTPFQVGNVKLPSNRRFSSGSGGGQTSTSRMMSGTRRVAESTPMTSLSSMRVHPSSGATMLPIRISESQERPASVRVRKHVEHESPLPIKLVKHSNYTPAPAQVLGARELSDPFHKVPARRSLPTPQASLGGSLGPSSASAQRVVPARREERLHRPTTANRVAPGPNGSLPMTIPNSQSSAHDLPFTSSEVVSKSPAGARARARGIPNTFFQPIDPSYEFSDDEDKPVVPPTTNAMVPAKSPAKVSTSSVPVKPPHVLSPFKAIRRPQIAKSGTSQKPLVEPGPSGVSKIKPMAPPTTPAARAQTQPRKSVVPESIHTNDFDELSGSQFLLMSRPRTNPQPRTKVPATVKVSNTPQVHSAPSRKRKLDAFQEPTVNAAPVAQALSAKESSPTNTDIKSETDETNIIPTLPKKTPGRSGKLSMGPSIKPPFPRSLDRGVRTGTPLLDLTPSRKQARTEIRDSEADSSSPLVPTQENTTTKARAGVYGPGRGRGRNQSWDRVPIVLRTPGGTLRKCGEQGFRCRKGFCFSCGMETEEPDTEMGMGNGQEMGMANTPATTKGKGKRKEKGKGKA